MTRKIGCVLFSILLLFSMVSPASANAISIQSMPQLSDMTELECLAFVKNCGVEIPDDYEDESQ